MIGRDRTRFELVKQQTDASKKQQRKMRKRRFAAQLFVAQGKGQRFIPPLLRGVVGLLLVGLGFLGFLPVLGFWMIPLGLALIATDIPPARRWLRRRLHRMSKDNR